MQLEISKFSKLCPMSSIIPLPRSYYKNNLLTSSHAFDDAFTQYKVLVRKSLQMFRHQCNFKYSIPKFSGTRACVRQKYLCICHKIEKLNCVQEMMTPNGAFLFLWIEICLTCLKTRVSRNKFISKCDIIQSRPCEKFSSDYRSWNYSL